MFQGELKNLTKAKYVAYLGVLTALVILFQAFGSYLTIGTTPISFVLVPIVLGGVLLGVFAGLVLGVSFALVVIIMGLTGADAFTSLLLSEVAFPTILVILLKSIAAGVVPALCYKAIAKKNRYVAVIVASVLAPVCNTGIFFIGCLTLFNEFLTVHFVPDGQAVAVFVLTVFIGFNFVIELLINVVLSPSVYTIVKVMSKSAK